MRSNLLLGLVVMAAACSVGSIDGPATGGPGGGGGGGGNGAPDAGTGGGMAHLDGGAGTATGDAAGNGCKNPITANLGNGHHNAGQDCQNGCHNHGFTLSGTLYTSAAGATAMAGASISVVDAAGQKLDMVSQSDGNFYTTSSVTFPVTVSASSCPNIQHMSATITAGSGGCNKSGCHTSGAQGYVHLP